MALWRLYSKLSTLKLEMAESQMAGAALWVSVERFTEPTTWNL